MMDLELSLLVFATLTFVMMMTIFLVRHQRQVTKEKYNRNQKDQSKQQRQQQRETFQHGDSYQQDYQELRNLKAVINQLKQRDSKLSEVPVPKILTL